MMKSPNLISRMDYCPFIFLQYSTAVQRLGLDPIIFILKKAHLCFGGITSFPIAVDGILSVTACLAAFI